LVGFAPRRCVGFAGNFVHDGAVRGENVDFAANVHKAATRRNRVDVSLGAVAARNKNILDIGRCKHGVRERCKKEGN
jgi:hypothetical protein